jgi:hypothetical protein
MRKVTKQHINSLRARQEAALNLSTVNVKKVKYSLGSWRVKVVGLKKENKFRGL